MQRDTVPSGFAELILTPEARKRLLGRASVASQVGREAGTQRLDGYLYQWLFATRGEIAGRGTDLFVPPEPGELFFLESEVLKPLLDLQERLEDSGTAGPEALYELRIVAASARSLGYRLVVYTHGPTGRQYVILKEDPAGRRRYWGTYVLRLGPARSCAVQVPRPIYERNSFEYGALLFERLRARALLIAGTHPRANRDGSSDVVQLRHKASLFNLATQLLVRETGGAPLLLVQVRAFGLGRAGSLPSEDMLLADGEGSSRRDSLGDGVRGLLDVLEDDGFTVRLVTGDAWTCGYEATSSLTARYARRFGVKEFCILWLSPFVRKAYMQAAESSLEAEQLAAAGVPRRDGDLYEAIASLLRRGRGPCPAPPLPPDVEAEARAYLERGDVIALARLKSRHAGRLESITDANTGLSFLLLTAGGEGGAAVVKLAGPAGGPAVAVPAGRWSREVWEDFAASRASFLVVGGSP